MHNKQKTKNQVSQGLARVKGPEEEEEIESHGEKFLEEDKDKRD